MSELAQLLIQAQGGNVELMQSATLKIAEIQKSQPAQLILELSQIVYQDANAKLSRQLAGILLKNLILNTYNDSGLDNLWENTPLEVKEEVRNNILSTLACQDQQIVQSTAQAVAAIAQKDWPINNWPALLNILIANAAHQICQVRQASLLTIGYICEALKGFKFPKHTVDEILTVVITNLMSEQLQTEERIMALKTLRNTIAMASENMQNDAERKIIVDQLISNFNCDDEGIRNVIMQTLCDIAEQFYDEIEGSLETIGTLSFQGILSDSEQVSILGVEFWNIIADKESQNLRKAYIFTAFRSLIPLLLQKVVNFELDDEGWNLHKAVGSTICAISKVVQDEILDACSPFIMTQIVSSDLKLKLSAFLVLGSVLEGSQRQRIHTVAMSLLQQIFNAVQDGNVYIRQTATWVLQRICKYCHSIIFNPHTLERILTLLIQRIQDQHKIACHACWAIINIVDSSREINLIKAAWFEAIVNALLQAAWQGNGAMLDKDLQISSFSCITTLIEKAPDSCNQAINAKIPLLLQYLQLSQNLANSQVIQQLLCSALQNSFVKIESEWIKDDQIAQTVQIIIDIFRNKGSIFEEGLLALGALASCIGQRFIQYLPLVFPYVICALEDVYNKQTCRAGIFCVGDLVQGLGDQISSLLPQICESFIKNLQHEMTTAELKIATIEILGDLSRYAISSYINYYEQFEGIVQAAALMSLQVVIQDKDPDLFYYLSQLREAIVQYYTCLIQGLHEIGKSQLIQEQTSKILEYALIISQDNYKPNYQQHLAVLGLIGDIIQTYQN